MVRSLLASMFWAAFILGVIAAFWSAGAAASLMSGAKLAGHPSTALRNWHDAFLFGLAAPAVLTWLQLAASIGALTSDAGRADE